MKILVVYRLGKGYGNVDVMLRLIELLKEVCK